MTRFLPALFAIALLNVAVTGCAQKKAAQPDVTQPKIELGNNCRSCHAPNAATGAGDFSAIYDNPASHHPVGVKYPDAGASSFAQPNGQSADGAFFDRNGNGRPDSDEIMLFGTGGEVTVECASCHKEHGNSLVSAQGSAGLYLRVENVGSAMCTTCHQY